jgi:hypothetical protein
MASATTAGFTPIYTHSQVMYVDIISTAISTTIARAKQPLFGNLFQEPVQKSQAVTTTKKIIDNSNEAMAPNDNYTPRTAVVPIAVTDAPDTTTAAAAATITRKGCLKKNYAIERRLVTPPRKFVITNQAKTNSDDDNSVNASDFDDTDDEEDDGFNANFINYKYVQVRPPGYIDPKKRSRMSGPPSQMSIVRKVSFNEELNETRLFCHDLISAVESVENGTNIEA